jgi:hypothetical protein
LECELAFVLGLPLLVPVGVLEPVLAFDPVLNAGCAFWVALAEFELDAAAVLLVEVGAKGPPL